MKEVELGKGLIINKNNNKVQTMFIKNISSQSVPKVEARRNQQDIAGRLADKQFWTQSQNRRDSQGQNVRFDRLDLVFRNEPKQIQDKLVKLLIRYNATMQYNRSSDMFEVDLLIPFKDENQKKEFIRQFLQIRRGKDHHNKGEDQNAEWIADYNQARRFSFNNQQNYSDGQKNTQQRKESEVWISQFDDPKNVIKNDIPQETEVYAAKKTGEFHQVMIPEPKQNNPIDFDRLQEVISRRLSNAVYIIKSKKNPTEDNAASAKNYYHLHQQNQSRIIEDSRPNETIREQSIIDQIQNQFSMNGTQKISDIKQANNSSYSKEDNQPLFQPSHSHYKDSTYSYSNDYDGNNYIGDEHNFIKIAQEPEQDENDPIYYEPKSASKGQKAQGKAISFEDFSKKYQSIKYEQLAKSKPMQKTFVSSDARVGQRQTEPKKPAKDRSNLYSRKK